MGRGSLPQRRLRGVEQAGPRPAVALDVRAIFQNVRAAAATRTRRAASGGSHERTACHAADLRNPEQLAASASSAAALLRSADAFTQCRSDAPAIPVVSA